MASQNDREMKIVILLLAAALLILGAVAVAAASDRTDRMPVAVFDLRRYMGTWYEIARYDHSFERRLAEARGYRTGKLLFVDQGQGISPPLP